MQSPIHNIGLYLLVHIETLTSMEKICLSETGVTEEGVRKLSQALPNTVVLTSWDKYIVGHDPHRSAAK